MCSIIGIWVERCGLGFAWLPTISLLCLPSCSDPSVGTWRTTVSQRKLCSRLDPLFLAWTDNSVFSRGWGLSENWCSGLPFGPWLYGSFQPTMPKPWLAVCHQWGGAFRQWWWSVTSTYFFPSKKEGLMVVKIVFCNWECHYQSSCALCSCCHFHGKK